MTNEEKAKAYDEALERARKQRDDYQKELDKTDKSSQLAGLFRAGITAIDMTFPELAESEDERIRKWLYDFIHNCPNETFEFYGGVGKKAVLAYLEKKKERLADNSKTSASDDEWIRNEILVYIGAKKDIDLETHNRWCSYLEKQKENPKSTDSIPSDCTSDAKYEDRWHKVEDSLPNNGRMVLANDCLGNTLLARYDGEGNWEVSVYDNEDYYCRNTIIKWCEIPSEKQKEPHYTKRNALFDECVENCDPEVMKKVSDEVDEMLEKEKQKSSFDTHWENGSMVCEQKEQKPLKVGENAYFDPNTQMWFIKKEQKPAEWDEFDKDCLKRAVWYIENPAPSVVKDTNLALWLKSLPGRFSLQPRQEWSEDDEEMIENIRYALRYAYSNSVIDEQTIEYVMAWLKSLRPSWKPSEEQMKALKAAMETYDGFEEYDAMKSLYEHLKKLM